MARRERKLTLSDEKNPNSVAKQQRGMEDAARHSWRYEPVAVTLQLTMKLSVLPEGKLGKGKPAPLSMLGKLAGKGQAAAGLPPVAEQLETLQLSPVEGISRTMAFSALLGPALEKLIR
jgi:hypothetical protein